ncbi:MAG: hypothetical protein WC725_02385 [Patescibacteria group bacterium]|jgi:hypothetical protein
MVNSELPKAVGEFDLSPVALSPKQEDLCRRLDDLHDLYRLKTKPSDMLRGAFFVSQKNLKANPDWMAQAANSLREILYPFYSPNVEDIPTNKAEALKKFGSVHATPITIRDMGIIYGKLNGLAHHGNVEKNNTDYASFSEKDFENLVSDFENVMLSALTHQIDIHLEIDRILKNVPETAKVDTSTNS